VCAALLCACSDGAGPGTLPTARLDFVDGALEPILSPGQSVVLEGFGFGTQPGTVTVRDAGGAELPAVVDAAAWTDFSARATLPAGAAAGPITLITAAGRRLALTVHMVPAPSFSPATLSWQAQPAFPRAPVGVAVAAAEFRSAGGSWRVTVYAGGGAEPLGGDSLMDADSLVYVASATAGGAVAAFSQQSSALPAPRAFAAAAVATRHNSRAPGSALYIIGGIDSAGRAQASVLAADVTADGVASAFVPVEPLPAPVAGAIAAVRRGRVYVMGGTDALGRPQRSVYVGRIGNDGRIDGWFVQPDLPAPRAYGGGVVLSTRALAFGGLADSTGPGGELDSTLARLATTDTASLSQASGFFTGTWAPGAAVLPAARSQFATLDLGAVVLVVGGLYSGAASSGAETLAAAVVGDSLGPFAGPVGANTIAGLGGGVLVGPAGTTWRDADGTRHGLVLGGFDLATRLRRAGVWTF
jgi:hypothetical protein